MTTKTRERKPAGVQGTMADIAENGATPMAKQTPPAEGLDARMLANNLANRVIATIRQDARSVWGMFALEVIGLPTDGRAQFIKTIKGWLADARKLEKADTRNVDKEGKPAPTKDEVKAAAARVNSATTQASKLSTIAHAWNSGGNDEDLLAYMVKQNGVKYAKVADVPYERIVEYARTFRELTAGRPADPFLLRITKALDKCQPRIGDDMPDTDEDKATHAALVALVAAALKARPELAEKVTQPVGL